MFMAVTKDDSHGPTTVPTWLQSEAAMLAPPQLHRWEPESPHWTTSVFPALSSHRQAGASQM